jgi:hypothetical protein
MMWTTAFSLIAASPPRSGAKLILLLEQVLALYATQEAIKLRACGGVDCTMVLAILWYHATIVAGIRKGGADTRRKPTPKYDGRCMHSGAF